MQSLSRRSSNLGGGDLGSGKSGETDRQMYTLWRSDLSREDKHGADTHPHCRSLLRGTHSAGPWGWGCWALRFSTLWQKLAGPHNTRHKARVNYLRGEPMRMSLPSLVLSFPFSIFWNEIVKSFSIEAKVALAFLSPIATTI